MCLCVVEGSRSFALLSTIFCIFVFAYAKIRFSYEVGHVMSVEKAHAAKKNYRYILCNNVLNDIDDYSLKKGC